MSTIAVTGATGFVGSQIAEVLQQRGHRVVGLVRSAADYPWDSRQINLADQNNIRQVFHDEKVDAVVHCAIANDFHMLTRDRKGAYDAYVGMTQRVVRAAEETGTQTVYISSDWVHDGTQHLVDEQMPANPLNIYGILKALSEQVVVDLATDGAVVRIGGVMGQHRLRAEGPRGQDVGFGYFVASLVRAIQSGERFAVWGGENVNEVATPSLASEIGAGVGRIAEKRAGGFFNLVCDDAVTRLELAHAACAAFDLDPSMVFESQVPESERFPALVPKDTSMSCIVTRQRLELAPTSLADVLQAFRTELETGKVSPVTTS